MSDGDVNAEELLLHVSCVEVGLLVDDGVDGDGCLAGLSVADDELSLSSADGHKSVNGLESGLHGLVDRLPGDDSRSFDLDSLPLGGFDWAEAVDGVAQGVEDSAQHFLSDGDIDDGAGPGDGVSFLDFSGWVKAYLSLPKMTTPTLSVSRLRAMPRTPERNSTISPAWTLLRPTTLAIPSPMLITVPNYLTSF